MRAANREGIRVRRQRPRQGWWLGIALVLMLGSVAPPLEAQNLSSRLRQLVRRQDQLRVDLRQIKQKQESATTRLRDSQQRVAVLEGRLGDARRQLQQTRRELETARAEIERLEALQEQHQEAIQAHLLALYRSEQSSYLNVVMQAESFEDFANRQHYARRMVNQDRYLLNRLEELQAEQQRQRGILEERESRRVALVQQIAADEAEARQRRNEVQSILVRANRERAAAEEMLAALRAEERAMQALARSSGRAQYTGTFSGNLMTPVQGRFTSGFGMRVNPVTRRYMMHNGIDLAAPTGTPIRAAEKGLVIAAGWRGSVSGNTVIIDHGSGLSTAYCHCSAVLVRVGQVVSRGQIIARVGSTGRSTGPHLHFGVMKNGNWVNPLSFTR